MEKGKAEKELLRRFKSYLTAAKKRYAKRIEKIDSQEKSLIVDRETFLAIQEERQELDRAVGDTWLKYWMLTGNQQLDDLYSRAGKERPLDLVFGNRDYARQLWNSSLEDITTSTGRSIMSVVERGLENGLSTRAIANDLEKYFEENTILDLTQITWLHGHGARTSVYRMGMLESATARVKNLRIRGSEIIVEKEHYPL